jgi:eukaryotic-like serine/threonine-protein kinase
VSQHNPAALPEGGVFHGRYQIVRCIKAGGMGAVYECVHLTTRKRRALKVMLPQILAAPGMRERFELEARVTAEIESEHIAETFDAGVDEATGAPFLVMELLRGNDLDTVLRSSGPFGAEEAVVLLSQAALALERTHAAGIVHRDLKPQNLFLTTRDDGGPRLKILDFGIAKVVADGTKTAQQTAAIGTPVYMSPEQTTGDGAIGPPADLYALAHIAYALLTGSAYWLEEQQTLPVYGFLSRMLAGPSELPTLRAARRGAALPPAFDAWFARATARSPAHRFDRATTQIAELARALGTAPPRQLLATPPVMAHRVPAVASPATPHQPIGALSQPAAPAATPLPSDPSRVDATRAPLTRSGATGGTMGALANDPATALPAASRAPKIAMAVSAVVVLAAGVFLVGRALVGPSRGSDASTAPTSLASPSGPASPAVNEATPVPTAGASASEAVAATATPPAEPSSVPASPASASSAPPTDRPKKPGPPSTPRAKAAAPPAAAPNCNPPFTVDANGLKHAKPNCL